MPSTSSNKQASPGKTSLLPGFLLLLFSASFAGWLSWSYVSDTHLSRQYHHAPGCFPGTRSDPALPPCRRATLLVTRRWGSKDNLLDLSEQGSDPQTETVNGRVWEVTSVGSTVTGQLWKGQIMRVWAGGQVSRTDDNPDHNVRQDVIMLGELGFLLLLCIGFLPAALLNWLRQLRGLPTSPERAYAVRQQGDCLTLSAHRYTQIGTFLLGLLMLGGNVFLVGGIVLLGHDFTGLSWPVLATGSAALALLAWLGRHPKFLVIRLPYVLLMIPVLLGSVFVTSLRDSGRILLFGDRWTFDRNRDRISHNDQPIASLSDIADVQLTESKSRKGSLRRSLRLAAKDGTEIGAGMVADADPEETEYVTQRLADFLGLPLQRRPAKDEEADAEQSKPPEPIIAGNDPVHLEVSYASTFADHWRTNLYFMGRRPFQTLYNLLVLPVFGGCFWLPPYLHQGDYLGAAGLAALLLAGSAALVAALTALFIFLILRRRRGNRGCRFIIGTNGFEDVMPEKTVAVAWRDVAVVEEHQGDLYFFRRKDKGQGKGAGTFLPRSAFTGRAEARRFSDAAIALWERGEAVETIPTPSQSGA